MLDGKPSRRDPANPEGSPSDAHVVVVRVTDTGVGLSPEHIQQLFIPFSRPHEGTGSGPRGTGLGLFISKGIVEQHGGQIWA